MTKAFDLDNCDQALNSNLPIPPDHEFYTEFGLVRGDFKERVIYRTLNVNTSGDEPTFDFRKNLTNKTLLFLGGMRGSGKTSQLAKYASYLNHPKCFYCVTCNIDDELDMNDVEYMDILIFQAEKLAKRLKEENIELEENAVKALTIWFTDRVNEINTKFTASGNIEVGVETGFGIPSLFKLFSNVKASIGRDKEQAEIVRSTFRNRFPDFATRFNNFVDEANRVIRDRHLGQEILFIVDGLEKAMTAEIRKKLVIDESNRIRLIKANTIFTLPIELMKERQKLKNFSEVYSFPFIKIKDRQGQIQADAYNALEEFVTKRIDKSLFESEEVIKKAIEYSGGSPRQLLQILEKACYFTDPQSNKITANDLEEALSLMGKDLGAYLTREKIELLKSIKECNENGRDFEYSDMVESMLEDLILMEYNDGTHKRPNPLLEYSTLYKQNVLNLL
jgi:hypothetical protein